MTIFNPLHHELESTSSSSAAPTLESTSSLINDTLGICPKCKKAFGSATVAGDVIFYCEPCRVSQPVPK